MLLEWLSTADVCVAPDPKDALNDISSMNKIVEYMAVGKPIVAFDLREMRISADAAAVYVAANDVAAFGDAIVQLLGPPQQRADMSVSRAPAIRDRLGLGASGGSAAGDVSRPTRRADVSASAGVQRGRRVADRNELDTAIEPTTEVLGDRRPQRDRLQAWLWTATLIWIVGMATVFPIGNEALDAVSVFTYDRIAFLAVAALFGLTLARNPHLLRRWGRIETLMGAYLAVILVSWATTLPDKHLVDVKRDGALLLNSFLMPYLAFVIGRHGVRTRAQVVTALAVLVVGIGSFLIGVGFIQGLVDWRFLVAAADQTIHQSRARGALHNALPYSVVLALLAPVALLLVRLESRRVPRALLIVLCIGCVEALVFGQVRIVWLAVSAALLYLAAVRVWMQRSAVVFAGGMLAAIGLGSPASICAGWQVPTAPSVNRTARSPIASTTPNRLITGWRSTAPRST